MHLEGVSAPAQFHSYALASGTFLVGLRAISTPADHPVPDILSNDQMSFLRNTLCTRCANYFGSLGEDFRTVLEPGFGLRLSYCCFGRRFRAADYFPTRSPAEKCWAAVHVWQLRACGMCRAAPRLQRNALESWWGKLWQLSCPSAAALSTHRACRSWAF